MLCLDETSSDMFVLVKEASLRHSRYYFATQTRAITVSIRCSVRRSRSTRYDVYVPHQLSIIISSISSRSHEAQSGVTLPRHTPAQAAAALFTWCYNCSFSAVGMCRSSFFTVRITYRIVYSIAPTLPQLISK